MSDEKLDIPVLKLNKRWIPIETISARTAFEDIFGGRVVFLSFTDGYPTPTSIQDWIKKPLDPDKDYLTTSRLHGLQRIEIPRVVITTRYDKFRSKEQPCTNENLAKRYGHKDAVTNKPLTKERFSREHVKPRSKGGRNGWENEVPMDKELNSRRGNKSYRRIGLRKPKVLGAPHPLLPINTLVNKRGFPEWTLFHIAAPEER